MEKYVDILLDGNKIDRLIGDACLGFPDDDEEFLGRLSGCVLTTLEELVAADIERHPDKFKITWEELEGMVSACMDDIYEYVADEKKQK